MDTQITTLISGHYRDIYWEVKNWESNWTYYITLKINRIPNGADFWTEWHNAPEILEELYFHGGITWWKRSGPDESRAVTIGCDFQHAGDEDEFRRFANVYPHVTRSIDNAIDILDYIPF